MKKLKLLLNTKNKIIVRGKDGAFCIIFMTKGKRLLANNAVVEIGDRKEFQELLRAIIMQGENAFPGVLDDL